MDRLVVLTFHVKVEGDRKPTVTEMIQAVSKQYNSSSYQVRLHEGAAADYITLEEMDASGKMIPWPGIIKE